MFKDKIPDRRKLKRPDIVIFPRLMEADEVPETFRPRRGEENMQVVLVEVSYTGGANKHTGNGVGRTEAEKE
eukprot:9315803-Pyramimonas_sp.AAC.1